jgi:alcohol dehydrogenase (NADP+)
MIQAKGYAAQSAKEPLAPYTFERRDPKEYDVAIDIKYCGICHSDIHMARNEWGMSMFPMVPGHEIAGVVRSVGSKVTKHKVGDHVGVGCFVDSCRNCEHCKKDLNQYCLEGSTLTYSAFERGSQKVTQGGYSNAIVVDENYVLRIPNSLPLESAAPLMCAGITLYSPLMHWNAGPGKKVAIMGLGGLGHMGVKLASALGAQVTVLSHSDRKREDALKFGADHFVATADRKVFQQHAGQFDLIINTVSADIDINDYLGLLKLDGTLVSVGAPEKPYSVAPFNLMLMRRSYAGSAIGSIKETQEMLDFCGKHKIKPEIEIITPNQVNMAYERVLKSDVRYRFVIDMSKL